eukprot:gene9494-6664_t
MAYGISLSLSLSVVLCYRYPYPRVTASERGLFLEDSAALKSCLIYIYIYIYNTLRTRQAMRTYNKNGQLSPVKAVRILTNRYTLQRHSSRE